MKAAPGQVLTPSAVSGTGHLETNNITVSHTSHRGHTYIPLLKLLTLTAWKCHQAEEQHQDSHAVFKALVKGDGDSPLGLGFQPEPKGCFALGEVPRRIKKHRLDLQFPLQD